MKAPTKLPLQLFLHTPSDDIISINNIDQNAKIHELKSHIEIRTGMVAEVQKLTLSNVKLEDTNSFSDINIKNGSVMRVNIKERSLEQIYLKAAKGDTKSVFMLGVEFIKDDDNLSGYEEEQTNAWNKFVPLRAFQALFAACFKGHLQLVAELINRSAAHVHMVSKNGRSVLHAAASQGQLSCISLLLAQGVDAKLTDGEGLSALALAAANGHVKCEKRIWLFNWNMDVLKDMGLAKNKTEEEKENEELIETAERYQKEYEKAKSSKSSAIFPPIKPHRVIKPNTTFHKVSQITNLPQVTSNVSIKQQDRGPIPSRISPLQAAQLSRNHSHHTSKSALRDTPELNMSARDTHKFNQSARHRVSSPRMTNSRVSNWLNVAIQNHSKKERTKPSNNETKRSPPDVTNEDHKAQQNEQRMCNENMKCNIDFNDEIKSNPNTLHKNAERNNSAIDEYSFKRKSVKEPGVAKVIPMKLVTSVDLHNDDNIRREVIKTDRSVIKNKDGRERVSKMASGFKATSEQSTKKPSQKTSEQEGVTCQISDAPSQDLDDIPTITISEDEINESVEESFEINVDEAGAKHIRKDVWRPESSFSYETQTSETTELITYYGKTRKSYEDWLDEKRQKKKERNADSQPASSRLDNIQNENKLEKQKEAYEKWLFTKARRRTRSTSEEDHKRKKTQLSRSVSEKAYTFEEWLENKKNIRPKSANVRDLSYKVRVREKLKHGMTFEEWKKWKRELHKNNNKQTVIENRDENRSNGVSFEKWLQAKDEERNAAMSILKTKYAQKEFILASKQTSRMNDPRQKTFEEWFLEKKYCYKVEKTFTCINKSTTTPAKHPEDSNLIFDMWLTNKYRNEMEQERRKLKDSQRKLKNKSLTSISEGSDDQYSSDSDDSCTSSSPSV